MGIPKRPDYGDATPEDLARALLRPTNGREREPPSEPQREDVPTEHETE